MGYLLYTSTSEASETSPQERKHETVF